MGKRTNSAVWLEKYHRWQIKVQKDGVRRTFTCPIDGRKGQRDCHAKADEWLDDNLENTDKKISVLFKAWYAELEARTGYAHCQKTKSIYNTWVDKAIGHKKAGSITEQNLQDIIIDAHRQGKSKKTLKNIRGVLTGLMKFLRKCKASKLMPEDLIVPKDAPVGQRKVLDVPDLIILFQIDETVFKGKIMKEWYINAYRFHAVVGLRPGEMLAIQIKRDIIDGYLYIRESLNSDNILTNGKNENALRKIFITPLMQSLIDAQMEQYRKSGIITPYLFATEEGDQTTQYIYRDRWKKFKKHNQLPDCTPYEFRHTFTSICKEKDVPEEKVKLILGHTTKMPSYETYGQELDDSKRTAAMAVEQAFMDVLKKTIG